MDSMWLDSISILEKNNLLSVTIENIISFQQAEPYFYDPLRWLRYINLVFTIPLIFNLCVLVMQTSPLFICHLVDFFVYFAG